MRTHQPEDAEERPDGALVLVFTSIMAAMLRGSYTELETLNLKTAGILIRACSTG